MDEVDRIIIHSLNDIGCVIDDNVTCLGQFSAELVVEASVKCLEVIRPGHGIPARLPLNMVARFNTALSIAAMCKDVGYRGDLGYQTFLYSNVTEVRRLFMFLIEKLPKESEKTVFEPDDPLSKLKANIGRVLKEQLSKCSRPSISENVPFISVPLETGICLPGLRKNDYTPQEWRDYCINRLPFLTDQVDRKFLLPSLVALNEQGSGGEMHIASDSERGDTDCSEVPLPAPRLRRPPTQAPRNTTWLGLRQNILYTTEPAGVDEVVGDKPKETFAIADEEPNGAEPVEESDEERKNKVVEKVKSRIEELQSEITIITSQITKAKDAEIQARSEMEERTKEVQVRMKALELFTEGEAGKRKLEEAVEAKVNRLVSLAAQWDEKRRPLIEKYREARKVITKSANESEKQMETVREMQDKLDSLNGQIALKNSIKTKLEEEYEKLPKNVNRSVYTRRILEIIGNIKKQGEEIDKVLNDTKELQKEINLVTGRLERSFTVTNEAIFRNAKRDESSRRAYKLLVTLHADCSDLVAMLQETGAIVRENRDLQDQIDMESAKNVGADLERIYADLQQIKVENAALMAQLKQLQPT